MTDPVVRLDQWRTDAILVESAKSGDREAKEALFRRHARTATDRAYRLLGRDSEVEDVVQESFATVFASLGKLQDPRAFVAWLGSIVTTTAIATIRRRRLLSRLGIVSLEPIQLESLIAHQAPADVVADLRAVYQSIDAMPAPERAVLILRRVEQLKLEEIAEQTRMSLATVKRKLANAEELLERWSRGGRPEGRVS